MQPWRLTWRQYTWTISTTMMYTCPTAPSEAQTPQPFCPPNRHTMHHCFIQTGKYLLPCKCLAPVSPPPSPWQPAQLCPLTNSRFSHSYLASTSSTSSTFPTCGLPQTPTAKHSLPRRPHLQTRESLTFYNPAPTGPLNCSNDTLLQLQADLLGVVVERSEMKETTALGAALLAGHAISLFG
ncbi:hypothetical protein PtB15_17B28 [Puccinia triticina]|nr:hypothetical protein PtB15_17B28 [Puccinia triticina]